MKQTMLIELTHENPAGKNYFHATLGLPATEYEIRDAYQRARITGTDDNYQDITVLDCPLMEDLYAKRLDSPTIDELNFLAKRLASLNEEEQLVLRAVYPKVITDDANELVSMKDLINCTYGLDTVMIAGGMTTDEQLGEFVIENELNDDVAAIPEDSMYLLDKAKIGKLQRESEAGVFLNGFYIIVDSYEMPEKYDGVTLPESPTEKWFAFKLKIAAPPKEDIGETADSAKWLTLPVSRKEADKRAKQLGMKRIEECVYLDFESSVPQISEEQFGNMTDFNKLNRLAELMPYLSPQDQVMFKAVLEAEQPADIDGVLSAIYSLTKYEMSTYAGNEGAFFLEYLEHHLDSRFDRAWLDTILARNEGKQLLEKLGATLTEYGVISARGRSLYELVPCHEENTQFEDSDVQSEEDDTQSEDCGMQMGGM